MATSNKQLVLPYAPPSPKDASCHDLIHYRLWMQKKYLDRSLYYHNKNLIHELTVAATQLQQHIDAITKTGHPVILAPLHTISDVVVGTLCSYLNTGQVLIISNHENESIGMDEVSKLNAHNMQLLNPQKIGVSELKRIIKQVKQHQSLFVIYPDVTPEITARLSRKAMRTFDCELFARKARLHSGLADLAKMTKATVLFFCLVEKQRTLAVDVVGTLPWHEILSASPKLIEQTIQAHADQWLLWHSPSLFYFNSADRL
ncbi:hypothetical protein ACE1B4_07990 [Aeromonas veronii]|uniref:hypothetical protein n=1 Tax=Aeromonas veronii TaxID=654 RepID=UPI001117A5D5|nr:hypothetical protein [Aeromonas veronii]TNI08370.1 hypothetical protein CF135_02290 [Aeromonas veronii]HDO1313432.1 hypothetical protein [Aeromonas veronii]HDO1329017.1 hypothetical protein [Aeromonas veronii]HDO1333421.1 hypothetical protein [Aeromonas veronii]HDO1337414.1 hypothetical protein [Aeromonas veronii]